MTTNELKDYLKAVIDSERTIYEQKKIYNNLKNEKSKLAIPKQIQEPNLNKTSSFWAAVGIGIGGAFPVGIVLWILSAFIPALTNLLVYAQEFYKQFTGPLLSGILTLLTYPLAGFVITFLLCFIICISDNKNEEKRLENKAQAYHQQLFEEKERLAKENGIAAHLDALMKSVKSEYDQTNKVLQDLYALDIIYPKYRNIIAVCMFYEYLDSKRCTTLDGHEGAINVYEMELRLNRIIGQLDTVISRLDEISQNQLVLFNAISEGNKASKAVLDNTYTMINQNNAMATQLNNINTNTAIGAYNAGIAARNSELMLRYKLREING